MDQLNFQGRSNDDYVATYVPTTSEVTRLQLENLDSDQPISVHGMDAVQPTSDGNELFRRSGCNGIVKASTNNTIYVSSTLGRKINVFKRESNNSLLLKDVVPIGIHAYYSDYSLGISRLPIIVDSYQFGSLQYELFKSSKFDNSEQRNTRPSKSGGADLICASLMRKVRLWTTFPWITEMIMGFSKDPLHLAPVAASKFSANTGAGSLYGEKYNVEKILEDDGIIISASTSIVHDSDRGLIFMHGKYGNHTLVRKRLIVGKLYCSLYLDDAVEYFYLIWKLHTN
ncbi:hypothetical protein EV368DRAFT_61843 [Lentinula lateritia]|nr:hypothetical protein EV368DRAFT_61843 [Lentinula lateritia]